MSHGPCDAACAAPLVAAVPASAPRMTVTTAPIVPSLRPLHALAFIPSPCSALSTMGRLLALTPRLPDEGAKVGPRCFGMQTLPGAPRPVKKHPHRRLYP